jgi:hypothetical protein
VVDPTAPTPELVSAREIVVVSSSELDRIASLAPDTVVIASLHPDVALLITDSTLAADTIGLVALAASDGSVVGGPAGVVAQLVADGATSPAAILRAHAAGADLDVDHDDEWLVPIVATRRVGARLSDATGDPPLCVRGPQDAVADVAAAVAAVHARVDALLDQPRLIAEPTPARRVGDELFALDLYRPDFCAELIGAVESFAAWAPDPDDPVPGVETSLRVAPALFDAIEADVATHVVPRLRVEWPEFAWCGLADAFVIRYDAVEATPELRLHHDVAQISAALRLNADFEGGALEFPRQRWDNRGLRVGELVAWPSLVAHPHRGAPVTAGRKYGLTLWFALPGAD